MCLRDYQCHTVCDWQISCCRRVTSFLSSLDFLPSFSSCVIFWAGVVRRWWSDQSLYVLLGRTKFHRRTPGSLPKANIRSARRTWLGWHGICKTHWKGDLFDSQMFSTHVYASMSAFVCMRVSFEVYFGLLSFVTLSFLGICFLAEMHCRRRRLVSETDLSGTSVIVTSHL